MERLLRRLNHTWQQLYRDRHLLGLYFQLNDAEYRLWDFYLATCDWDKKHVETIGTVDFTDRDVAKILVCSHSKVCRARQGLTGKGVIKKKRAGLYIVLPTPELPNHLNTLKEKVAWVDQQIASMQQDVAPAEQTIAPVQQNQAYSDDSSIVSYKDEYSLDYPKTVIIKQVERNEQEYLKMWEEMNKPADFTTNDMRWIDNNVVEKKVIDNSVMEKDIVDIFFDGNWERYRRNLIT